MKNIALLLALTLTAALTAAAADFTIGQTGWSCDPGAEFPGAQGSVKWIDDPEMGATLQLDYDLTKGGVYVGALWTGAIPKENTALTYWAKGAGSSFRVRNASGQWLAGRLIAPQKDKWTRINADLSDGTFNETHWGGANDGKLHLPITAFMIASESKTENRLLLSKITFSNPRDAAASLDPNWGLELKTSAASGIAFVGDQAEYQIIVDNRLPKAQAVQLRVETVSDAGATSQQTFDIQVKAAAKFTQNLALPTSEIGFQSLDATVLVAGKPVCRGESGFAVVPAPVNHGQDDPDNFFGMCEVWDYDSMERLGCRTVRMGLPWDYWDWNIGENRLPQLNRALEEELEKHHMTALLTISSYAPHWAERKGEKYRKIPNDANIADWGKFVKRLVEHLQSFPAGRRIRIIDIDNEPDLDFWLSRGLSLDEAAAIYAKLYKTAGEAVRSVKSEIAFGGIGVSGGMFEMGMPFPEKVFATGVKSDVFTGHPYPASRMFGPGFNPFMPDDCGFEKACHTALEFMAKHGCPRRFCIAEYGWGLDPEAKRLSRYAMLEAAAVARVLILAKSVPGVEGFYYFMQRPILENGGLYGLFRGEQGKLSPLPAAGAYAQCAKAMHLATLVRPLKTPAGVRSWLFDRKADGLAVVPLWTLEGTVTFKAALPASTELFNMLGRKIPAGPAITLDQTPVYLVAKLADAAALATAVERAGFTGGKPLAIKNGYLNRIDEAVLDLSNTTAGELFVTIDAGGRKSTRRIAPGRTPVAVAVAPETARGAAPLPVTVSSADGGSDAAQVACAAIPLRKIKRADITGAIPADTALLKLSADQRAQVQPPDPAVPWHGPADVSLNAWFAWTADGLYLAAQVRDDIHHTVPDPGYGSLWMGDSIQVAVDPNGDCTTSYGPAVREFGIVLDGTQTKCFANVAPFPYRAKAVRLNGETRYEALIPWASLGLKQAPAPGKVMAINIIANDDDGEGRKCWIGLTPGIGDTKSPKAYKRFFISE